MGKNRGKASNDGQEMAVDQFTELSAATIRCLPREVSPLTQKMIEKPRLYKPALRSIFFPPPPAIITGQKALDEWHKGWPKFWRCFGFNLDGPVLETPECQPGFGWSIVTPQGLTNNQAYEICQKRMGFPCWRYWPDLDKIKSDREPDRTHLILCRDRVEADEELKSLSANQILEQKLLTVTMREREVLEARYYSETGQHLDRDNWTLCPSSRHPDGYFLELDWDPDHGEFQVHYAYPDGAAPRLRSRAVVVVAL